MVDATRPIGGVDVGSVRATHGTRPRDAAFVFAVSGEAWALEVARSHLMDQVRNPHNELWRLCIAPLDGSPRDAWFFEAAWLLRHAVLYELIRDAMSEPDRSVVEHWLRTNAQFFAAHTDWGLDQIFPGRSSDDYRRTAGPAAAADEARWFRRRFDTNGDCKVDAVDDPAQHVVRAYALADGSSAPPLSVVSQYYNNRRAAAAAAFGYIGVALDDRNLVERSKRYFREWLAFGVWPDGSQGEFNRNGDYCLPGQGLVYGAANIQAMALVAVSLAKRGDLTLLRHSTNDGLFGTEARPPLPPKSLSLVIESWARLLNGGVAWYMHEPWLGVQKPRPATLLVRAEQRYMNSTRLKPLHELGLTPLIGWPEVPEMSTHLGGRLALFAAPGSVERLPTFDTGFGTATDSFNAMPSAVLLRATGTGW